MKFLQQLLVALALNIALIASASAAKADDAKALVEKAIAHVKQVGVDQAFKDFNNPTGPWVKGELYIFASDYNGVNLALGANPKLVGKSLLEMKSPDGKFFAKEFIQVAKTKGAGWVDYQWVHPDTKKIVDKSSYIMKVPGVDALLGCGIYKE